MNILALESVDAGKRFRGLLQSEPEIVLFDILDHPSLVQTGRLIWDTLNGRSLFSASSSGLEYALTAYWRAEGMLAPTAPREALSEVDRIVVVSGSCSPVTEGQIRWALANGFDGLPLNVDHLATSTHAIEVALRHALESLAKGRSVVLYTALGPDSFVDHARNERAACDVNQQVGTRLGLILNETLARTGIRRAVVAGGDTGGHAAHQLNIDALTLLTPVAPGGPVCRAWSADPRVDGMEIVFKGGQVGDERFFGSIRKGSLVA